MLPKDKSEAEHTLQTHESELERIREQRKAGESPQKLLGEAAALSVLVSQISYARTRPLARGEDLSPLPPWALDVEERANNLQGQIVILMAELEAM